MRSFFTFIIIVLLIGILFNCNCANVKEQYFKNRSEEYKQAVVKINGYCSGFFVTPSIVVTARHCLNGKEEQKILLFGGEEIIGVEFVEYRKTPYDITALQTKHKHHIHFNIKFDFPIKNRKYNILGFPSMIKESLYRRITYRRLTGVATFGGLFIFFLFNGTIMPGDSGSVVYDNNFNVIGVVTAIEIADVENIMVTPTIYLGSQWMDWEK